MKKIILKSALFILPFLGLFLINSYSARKGQGDLARLGYLYSNPTPKITIKDQFSLSKKYTLVSELLSENFERKEFDVLNIGDSFSEQDSLGFQNFLAHKGLSVLHIDRFISENPIKKLVALTNGDFFDSIRPTYVVLQSVERWFVQRTDEIDFKESIYIDSIKNLIANQKPRFKKKRSRFFSRETIETPLINLKYLFTNKPNKSQTYKVTTKTTHLFSNNPSNLLFYQDDLDFMKVKNDAKKITSSNSVINKISEKLSKKGIKLILLISPDKYDLYYPYIKESKAFEKPLFFEYYEKEKKSYYSVPTFKILRDKLAIERDIYYYDDTHWSPKAAGIVADEIYTIIKQDTLLKVQ